MSRSLCLPFHSWAARGSPRATDALLRVVVVVGCLAGVGVVVSAFASHLPKQVLSLVPSSPVLLFVCWLCWLSLVTVCGEFTSFPWDRLMCEAGFLAIWLPALPTADPHTPFSPPHAGIWLAMQLLVFRVMLGMGKIKFDGVWWDSKAQYIRRFLIWQPLPTKPAFWMAMRAPVWLMAGLLWAMFAAEMLLPFAVFVPSTWAVGRILRVAFAVGTIGLQAGIAVTGNYGTFGVLTGVLALSVASEPGAADVLNSPEGPAHAWVYSAACVAMAATRCLVAAFSIIVGTLYFPRCSWCSSTWLYWIAADPDCSECLMQRSFQATWWKFLFWEHRFPRFVRAFGVVRMVLRTLAPLRLVHAYGVFTTEHPVPASTRTGMAIQGSVDGKKWEEYHFWWVGASVRCVCGRLTASLLCRHRRFPGSDATPLSNFAPHQPRVDHQAFYAGLRVRSGTCWPSPHGVTLASCRRTYQRSP